MIKISEWKGRIKGEVNHKKWYVFSNHPYFNLKVLNPFLYPSIN